MPDPDQMLAAQRRAITDWEQAPPWGPAEREAAERATGAAAALDDWLSHGGSLPQDWAAGAGMPPADLEEGTSILQEQFGSHTVLIHKNGTSGGEGS